MPFVQRFGHAASSTGYGDAGGIGCGRSGRSVCVLISRQYRCARRYRRRFVRFAISTERQRTAASFARRADHAWAGRARSAGHRLRAVVLRRRAVQRRACHGRQSTCGATGRIRSTSAHDERSRLPDCCHGDAERRGRDLRCDLRRPGRCSSGTGPRIRRPGSHGHADHRAGVAPAVAASRTSPRGERGAIRQDRNVGGVTGTVRNVGGVTGRSLRSAQRSRPADICCRGPGGEFVQRRLRQFVITSLVLWVLAVGLWVLLLADEKTGGCPGFAEQGWSLGGPPARQETWEWFPPGLRCAYVVAGRGHVDEPPTARIAVIGLLVAWPIGTLTGAYAAGLDRRGQ